MGVERERERSGSACLGPSPRDQGGTAGGSEKEDGISCARRSCSDQGIFQATVRGLAGGQEWFSVSREKSFMETPKPPKSTASWNVIDSSTLLIPEGREKKRKPRSSEASQDRVRLKPEKKLLILKVGSHNHQQRMGSTGLVIAAQGWKFP